jgi:hypothetical protein
LVGSARRWRFAVVDALLRWYVRAGNRQAEQLCFHFPDRKVSVATLSSLPHLRHSGGGRVGGIAGLLNKRTIEGDDKS